MEQYLVLSRSRATPPPLLIRLSLELSLSNTMLHVASTSSGVLIGSHRREIVSPPETATECVVSLFSVSESAIVHVKAVGAPLTINVKI